MVVLDASRPRGLRLTWCVSSQAIFVGVLFILTSLFTIEAVATAPGAPTGLTATAGDGQVRLSWNHPSNTGSIAIDDYQVERYDVDPDTVTTAELGESTTSTTVTGLTNGTSYTFKVRAGNDTGFGAFSASAKQPLRSLLLQDLQQHLVRMVKLR